MNETSKLQGQEGSGGEEGRGGGRLASEQRRRDESVTQRTTRRKKMEVIRVSESTEKFGGFFLKEEIVLSDRK